MAAAYGREDATELKLRTKICHPDQDCGANFLCTSDDPCGQMMFACQNERDECTGSADCQGGVCFYDEPQQHMGHRFCGDPGCAAP